MFCRAVELLLWDTSIQGTPTFREHKIWPRKNVYIMFVFVTSIEGTPLFRGKGHFFLGSDTWIYPPFRGHLSNQKVTYHKNCDKLKCLTAFKTRLTHLYRCTALVGIQHLTWHR